MPKCSVCNLCGSRHLASRSCRGGFESRVVYHMAARKGSMYSHVQDQWPGHHMAGTMCQVCPHCHARSWTAERIQCCEFGKLNVSVAYEYDVPDQLRTLLRNSRIRDRIRQYNMAMAMASVGHQRHYLNGGPCTFILGGRTYHRISSARAADSNNAKFAQIYTLAVEDAVDRRMDLQHQTLDREVLRQLHVMFMEYNPWVRRYVSSAQCASPLTWKWNGADDMNDAMVMGALIADHGSQRDIKLIQTDGTIIFINDGHCLYHPLAYPILFPSGQVGWHWGMQSNDGKKVTLTSYMKYILMHREEPSHIQRCGKLALESYCDAWASVESQKCDFHRLPSQQKIYRSCSRAALADQLQHTDIADIGTLVIARTILPASHVGGPRYYHRLFQNAMALPRRFGRPDLFLTMTCNPQWSEIVSAIPMDSSWQDHPDIVARVFMIKVASLIHDIRHKNIFGDPAAIVYRIEWQARGLPHVHMLIILKSHIYTSDDVDQVVCAEVPDPDNNPMLHELVNQYHIHKPCDRCKEAGCRQKATDGKCHREFPKRMMQRTNLPLDGFPLYRRRGRFNTVVRDHNGLDRIVTDEWVVPYSPFLLLRYQCHLNVEVACHLHVFKYVYKYIFKAPDSASIAVDEINAYLQGRLLTASEAVFRILGLSLHGEWPPVFELDIHLPEHERMVFDPMMGREELQNMVDTPHKTTLTAWFELNATDTNARQYLYSEIPEHYCWNSMARSWIKRSNKCIAVGRIYSVAVSNIELFAMRQLLDVVRGAVSFRDLLHVNGIIYGTFVEACIAKGLRDSDDAILCVLQELFQSSTSPALCREHFANVLLNCQISNANHLFHALSHDLCDIPMTPTSTKRALADIDFRLRQSGRLITDFGFEPVEVEAIMDEDENAIDDNWIRDMASELLSKCTQEQASAIERVQQSLIHGYVGPNIFVVEGAAGTGKTLWTNALTTVLRTQGFKVLCIASSALAASLMINGKTAHSALRIPIPAHEDSYCSWDSNVKKEIRRYNVIIWDEMSMINKHIANAVDASFQEVHNGNRPFGGTTVVFVGDFQQLPPVIPKGKGEYMTMHRCYWWELAQKTKFTLNWRANAYPEFAHVLTQIGNGSLNRVHLPQDCHCNSATELINRVYGSANEIIYNHDDKMILSLRVDDARMLNDMVMEMIPGASEYALAFDKIPVQDSVPPEFIASMVISGVPDFRIPMKIGARYMILKNYSKGICNGILCILKAYSRFTVQVQMLTGPLAGSIMPLPRVTFNVSSSASGLPFDFIRNQFPFTVAYCVTVHKSQGQTLKYVGLFFTGDPFAHGQLYVALSRVGNWCKRASTQAIFTNIVLQFLITH